MKQIFLVAALAASLTLQAQSQQSENRVGYANLPYIMSKLPDVKQIETDLKSTQTQLQSQIEVKTREVRQQYTDFNENMDRMVDSVRTRRQQDLELAVQSLEKMQQDAELTLQNKQKLYMAPLYLKVNNAIAEVAKENGFEIILTERISNYQFLLYQVKEVNISDLVLKKFGVTPETK